MKEKNRAIIPKYIFHHTQHHSFSENLHTLPEKIFSGDAPADFLYIQSLFSLMEMGFIIGGFTPDRHRGLATPAICYRPFGPFIKFRMASQQKYL